MHKISKCFYLQKKANHLEPKLGVEAQTAEVEKREESQGKGDQ